MVAVIDELEVRLRADTEPLRQGLAVAERAVGQSAAQMAAEFDRLEAVPQAFADADAAAEAFGGQVLNAFGRAVDGADDLGAVLKGLAVDFAQLAAQQAAPALGSALGGPAGSGLGDLIGGLVGDLFGFRGREAGTTPTAAPVTVTVNMTTPDAATARASAGQLGAQVGDAVRRGLRNR